MPNDNDNLKIDAPVPELKKRTRGLMVMAAASLGLPEDLPTRSLAMLRTADLLVFEEDRPARSFLKAAGVFRDYLKYNEHHQSETLSRIREALTNHQTVVYMSDQGTPTLADPGSAPIKIAWDLGAEVRVIPGPSSVTAALSATPFNCDRFYFGGFLSRDHEERLRELQVIRSLSTTWVVMDTPYRLHALLEACSAIFPAEMRAMVALDISGPQEDYWLGTFPALKKRAESLTEKLNFVLIGEGTSSPASTSTSLKENGVAPGRNRSRVDNQRRKRR